MKKITKEQFIELQENNQNFMVDISAVSWCGPCRILQPILNSITPPNNVGIFELDYDENKEFVSTLNVKSLPTVLFFKGKEEIDRIVGLKTLNDYNNKLNTLY